MEGTWPAWMEANKEGMEGGRLLDFQDFMGRKLQILFSCEHMSFKKEKDDTDSGSEVSSSLIVESRVVTLPGGQGHYPLDGSMDSRALTFVGSEDRVTSQKEYSQVLRPRGFHTAMIQTCVRTVTLFFP